MPVLDKTARSPADIGKGRKAVLPPSGQKWTQEQVHYRSSVEPGGCQMCEHYSGGARGQCQVVAGFIQRDAVCDFFNDDDAPPPPVSKFDSGYLRVAGAVYQCGDCAFFDKVGGCQIVEGPIDAGGVCWEWNGEPGQVGAGRLAGSIAENVPNEPPLDVPPGG